MEANQIPAWLETLRNVSPSLADRAEVDVRRWMNIEDKAKRLINRLDEIENDYVFCPKNIDS